MTIAFTSLDLGIIFAYFVLVTVVGLAARYKQRATDEDYFLAGRRLTLPLFVMSLTATFYGGVLGVGEFTYLYGVSNWVTQALPYYVFAGLFAWFLAEKVQRKQFVSLPDIFHDRFGPAAGYCAALFVFILSSPAPYILMLATIVQLVLGWSLIWCLAFATVISMVYLLVGGFRSDIWTDTLEFVLMFVGMAIILPFAFVKVASLPDMLAALPPLHRTWHGGNTWQYIVVWFFIALWTFVDPSFHQRSAAAATPRIARTGILWSILFWALFDAITTLAGLYARVALPDLSEPMLAFPLLASKVLPAGLLGLFFVGMLATVMSTSNSMVFLASQSLTRDLWWRCRGATGGAHSHMWIGLSITSLCSLLLAYFLPSVVGLWYSIATVVLPALLIPTLWYYLAPKWPIERGLVLPIMLLSSLCSTVWLLIGLRTGTAFFGIEPMYPGLLLAMVLWLLAILKSSTHWRAGSPR